MGLQRLARRLELLPRGGFHHVPVQPVIQAQGLLIQVLVQVVLDVTRTPVEEGVRNLLGGPGAKKFRYFSAK
jgi:hypothetical protein